MAKNKEDRFVGKNISFNPHLLNELVEKYENKKEEFRSFSDYVTSIIKDGLKYKIENLGGKK